MLTRAIPLPRLPRFVDGWLKDPPPHWVLEFSAGAIVRASTGDAPELRWQGLGDGVLTPSPVEANFKQYDAALEAVRGLSLEVPHGRTPECALLLPDYSVRVSVLEFEEFPAGADEQEPLVRFRLKKIVPYDLDSARLSFVVIPVAGGPTVVVASLCPLHILAEYESLLLQVGAHPGEVSSSAVAALSLLPSEGISVLTKWSGAVATVAVVQAGVPRLFRTVEMLTLSWEELLGLLHPTFATVEDKLRGHVDRLLVCGKEAESGELGNALAREFGVNVTELASPFGKPTATNAGALGYLAGAREAYA
jgi:type IV pilus assembly protein PilM